MEDVNEIKVGEEETKEETVEATKVMEQVGPGKKIVKIVLTGLAFVATGIVGFIFGRSGKEDKNDDSNEDANNESTDE